MQVVFFSQIYQQWKINNSGEGRVISKAFFNGKRKLKLSVNRYLCPTLPGLSQVLGIRISKQLLTHPVTSGMPLCPCFPRSGVKNVQRQEYPESSRSKQMGVHPVPRGVQGKHPTISISDSTVLCSLNSLSPFSLSQGNRQQPRAIHQQDPFVWIHQFGSLYINKKGQVRIHSGCWPLHTETRIIKHGVVSDKQWLYGRISKVAVIISLVLSIAKCQAPHNTNKSQCPPLKHSLLGRHFRITHGERAESDFTVGKK